MIRSLFKKQAMTGFVLLLSLGSVASAQENTLQEEYQNIYQAHQQALLKIASKCEQLDRQHLADFTRSWVPPKDPARKYFYQRPGSRWLKFPKTTDQTDQFWLKSFRENNETYAGKLLQLCGRVHPQGQFHGSWT